MSPVCSMQRERPKERSSEEWKEAMRKEKERNGEIWEIDDWMDEWIVYKTKIVFIKKGEHWLGKNLDKLQSATNYDAYCYFLYESAQLIKCWYAKTGGRWFKSRSSQFFFVQPQFILLFIALLAGTLKWRFWLNLTSKVYFQTQTWTLFRIFW